MSQGFTPAIIALAGVFFSAILSAIIAIRQTRVESQKIRDSHLHIYAEKIFEKRIVAYPKIIEHLVKIIQKVNLHQEITISELESLSIYLLEWNQKYSALTSVNTEQVLHYFYTDLNSRTKKELEVLVSDQNSLLKFRDKMLEFYLALKGDLGVYALISPASITGFKSPKTIYDVSSLYKRIKKKVS